MNRYLCMLMLMLLNLLMLVNAPFTVLHFGAIQAQEYKSPETEKAYLQFQQLYQSHQAALSDATAPLARFTPRKSPDSVFIMPIGSTPRLLAQFSHPLVSHAPAGIMSTSQVAVIEAAVRRGECRTITLAIDPHDPVLYELRHASEPHDSHPSLNELYRKAQALKEKFADPDHPDFVKAMAETAMSTSMARLFSLSPLIADLARLDAILVTGAYLDTRTDRLSWVGSDDATPLFRRVRVPERRSALLSPLEAYNNIKQAHQHRNNQFFNAPLDDSLWIQSAQSGLQLRDILGISTKTLAQVRQVPGLYTDDTIQQIELMVRLHQSRLVILSMNIQHPMISSAIQGEISEGLLHTPTRNLLIIKKKLQSKYPDMPEQDLRFHLARQLLLHQIKAIYLKSDGLRTLDSEGQLLILAVVVDEKNKSFSIEGQHPRREEIIRSQMKINMSWHDQWSIWKLRPRFQNPAPKVKQAQRSTDQPATSTKTAQPKSLSEARFKSNPPEISIKPVPGKTKGQPGDQMIRSNEAFRIPRESRHEQKTSLQREIETAPKRPESTQPEVKRPSSQELMPAQPQYQQAPVTSQIKLKASPNQFHQAYFSGRVELSHVTMKNQLKSDQPHLITQISIAKPARVASLP